MSGIIADHVSPSSGGQDAEVRCQPPANVRREVAAYDQRSRIGHWEGPRYRMTYWILGDGPPLILIPGIASTYRVYAMLLNRLGERFQTIQYAYPGEVEHDGARLQRIRHDHQVEDLIGLADHLGIERFHLLGISFGSTVAFGAMHRWPERVQRSAVQGAFARRRFTAAERIALALGRRIPGTAIRLPLRETVLTYNARMHFPAILEDRWWFYLEQNGQVSIPGLAHRATLVSRLDLRPILPQIRVPLLLVQGREDRIVTMRDFEELRQLMPSAESSLLPTVGHLPHLTHVELLERVLRAWLDPSANSACGSEVPSSRDRCPGSVPGTSVLPCSESGCPRESGETPGPID
jgi:3-oxoadipate enol-lactonase